VAKQRPRHHRPAAITDFPQLFSRPRIVSHRGHRTGADQLQPAAEFDHLRRAERLLEVEVERAVIDRAIGLPDGLARVLVQGDDVLDIASVDVDQEQVLEQDRRRTGALVMIAIQVAARPEDSARCRVQAGRAVRSEVDIDAARFHGGRGRRIAVHHADVLRVGRVEDFDVMNDLSGLAIHADGEHLGAVGRGGGEPDLALPDHRRGPTEAGDRRLPSDVFGFAPRHRQPTVGRMTVPRRPAKLRPRLASRRAHRDERHNPTSDQLANHRSSP